MNYRRPFLIILLLHYPHRLESRQRSKHRASYPSTIFLLGRGNDVDLRTGERECYDFLMNPVGRAREHQIPFSLYQASLALSINYRR
jgi:hypothetical protein